MDRQNLSRGRPRWLRALGDKEPPTEIELNGRSYFHERTIKHDSWAATAVYRWESHRNEDGLPQDSHRIVCKFNRVYPLGAIPCRWLGRWLAWREARMYARLAGIPGVVACHSKITSFGQALPHAVAHDYIAGHPLRWQDQPPATFFETLHTMLQALHARNVAYIDLNKWENILRGEDGQPYLIDFQISVYLPPIWPLSMVLRLLQRCDLYHLSKHAHRIRPQQFGPDHFTRKPWWIRLHRLIAGPFRAFRRWLLVRLGVRQGQGKPYSEAFVEEGLRVAENGHAPVERLYQLIHSDDYFQSVDRRGGDFVITLFEDLMGRPPINELESQYLRMLASRTRHDQIVWLLKSELFLAHTHQWSDTEVERVTSSIQQQLGRS